MEGAAILRRRSLLRHFGDDGLALKPLYRDHPWEYLQEITFPILIIGVVYCLVLYIGDVYDFQQDYRQVMNFGRVLISCWAGGLVAALIVYFPYKSGFIGRTLLIILTASFSMLVAFGASAFRRLPCRSAWKRNSSSSGPANPGATSWEP